jgi:hypothetical protein
MGETAVAKAQSARRVVKRPVPRRVRCRTIVNQKSGLQDEQLVPESCPLDQRRIEYSATIWMIIGALVALGVAPPGQRRPHV